MDILDKQAVLKDVFTCLDNCGFCYTTIDDQILYWCGINHFLSPTSSDAVVIVFSFVSITT